MNRVEKSILALFAVIAAVSLWAGVASVSNTHRQQSAVDWVNHTHALILEADAIVSSLHAGEAALRNFLLTGDAHDQAAYRQAYADAVEHLEVAKTLASSEARGGTRFSTIEELVQKRIAFARTTAQSHSSSDLASVRSLLSADSADTVVTDLRKAVAKIKDELAVSLQQRDREAATQAANARVAVVSSVVVNIVLLCFSFLLLKDDLRMRKQAQASLTRMNEELERRVADRTAELQQSNAALKEENLERRWTNEAIQHQLRYSQLMVNAVADPVLMITKQLNVVRANPAALQWLGLDEKAVIGQPVTHFLTSEKKEPLSDLGDQLRFALKQGHDLQNLPGQLRSAANPTGGVSISAFPVRDADRVVGAVLTARRIPGI